MFTRLFRANPTEVPYSSIAQDDTECNPPSTCDHDAEFGGREARLQLEKKLVRKVDVRMSILILIHILNYIDRNNAAAARLRGFEEDLHLKGQQFNTIISILYVGYVLMQVPSNMFLHYIGKPSIYLPTCMIIWGLISVLTGAAQTYVGVLFARFFLGFVEAAFFPGALLLISKWYKRGEIGLRMAILTCGSMISYAFGALLASIILDCMEGRYGQAAWRWLFFIEGGLTIVIALVALFVLPDFPATSTFLTPLERRLALKRMVEDVGVGDGEESEYMSVHSTLRATLEDWKVWWLALGVTSLTLSLSFSAFFPTLAATLGYSRNITLLLCAPPWVVAAGASFIVARHSDATGERFYHIAGPLAVGLVGFIIAALTMNTASRYVALFLMTFSQAGYVCNLAWISSTIHRPPSKRAIVLAFTNACSQLGGIAGPYVWPISWGPTYRLSYAICILTNALVIAMYWFFREHLRRENLREEEQEAKDGRVKGFRYLL